MQVLLQLFITVESHLTWQLGPKVHEQKLFMWPKLPLRILSFKRFNTAAFHTGIGIHCCFFHSHLVKWMTSLWGHVISENRDTLSTTRNYFLFLPFYFPPSSHKYLWIPTCRVLFSTLNIQRLAREVSVWPHTPERHRDAGAGGSLQTHRITLMAPRTAELNKWFLSLCWALIFEFV